MKIFWNRPSVTDGKLLRGSQIRGEGPESQQKGKNTDKSNIENARRWSSMR